MGYLVSVYVFTQLYHWLVFERTERPLLLDVMVIVHVIVVWWFGEEELEAVA